MKHLSVISQCVQSCQAFALVKERGTGCAVNEIKLMGGCKVLLKSDCLASPSNIQGKDVHWGLDHSILAKAAGQIGLKACIPKSSVVVPCRRIHEVSWKILMVPCELAASSTCERGFQQTALMNWWGSCWLGRGGSPGKEKRRLDMGLDMAL